MSIFLYVKTKSSRSDRGQLKGAGLRSGGDRSNRVQTPESPGTCCERADREGAAPEGGDRRGPGQMRQPFQRKRPAASGEEDRKRGGLGGVEAEGGRRLVVVGG